MMAEVKETLVARSGILLRLVLLVTGASFAVARCRIWLVDIRHGVALGGTRPGLKVS